MLLGVMQVGEESVGILIAPGLTIAFIPVLPSEEGSTSCRVLVASGEKQSEMNGDAPPPAGGTDIDGIGGGSRVSLTRAANSSLL